MDISLPPVMMGLVPLTVPATLVSGLGSVKPTTTPHIPSSLAYEGQEMVMHCDASVAKVNYGRTVKVRLSHVQDHPGADMKRREICTFDPVSEQFGKNLSSVHPD